MIYHVTHETSYAYSSTVSMSHNIVHLAARSYARQTRLRHDLQVSVSPAVSAAQTDYFGNLMTFMTVQEPHRRLHLRAVNEVNVHPEPPPAAEHTMPWDTARDVLRSERSPEMLDAYEFAFDSPSVRCTPELADYAAPSFAPGRPLLDSVLDLTNRIHTEFRYDPNATTTATPLSEVLELRRGVCQDFAHLEIGCLRSLGLAARYVSGYLLTSPPPGRPRLIGADASHAWIAVYLPQHGWIEVDPTNNLLPDDKHIVLAWGRDYDDVSPIKGVILGGGHHSVAVAVNVVPRHGTSYDRNPDES
ncbi:MAG: transglutaminase family protein [Isosphaeraceae bacterium]|nr:transglutaminase family protein [Isosphaeraceae bacterium]